MPTRLLLLIVGLMLAGCSKPQVDRSGQSPKATAAPAATASIDPRPAALDPSPTPSPFPGCTESEGRVERVAFTDPVQTSKMIPVNIYLPPCYPSSGLGYPVVYLLHGYPQDEQHWLDLGLLEVIEDQQAEEWPPFISVMPFQPEPYFTHTDGGPGSWEAVMLDGLVPYIDANYHTLDQASSRALLGISRGGVWALEIGLRNPQVFDTVGALSPALIVNHPRPSYDPARIVRDSDRFPPNLWLSTGDSEPTFRQGVVQFAAVLDQEGISYTYYEYPGKHEDAAWATALQPALAFVIAAWQGDGG
jgi:enterochelin esterase-like enzyme